MYIFFSVIPFWSTKSAWNFHFKESFWYSNVDVIGTLGEGKSNVKYSQYFSKQQEKTKKNEGKLGILTQNQFLHELIMFLT